MVKMLSFRLYRDYELVHFGLSVEDVMQECYLKLLTVNQSINEKELYTTLKNCIVDLYKYNYKQVYGCYPVIKKASN